MTKIPECNCTARCGDDPGIHERKVKTCKRFDEQATRTENSRLACCLLVELGATDQTLYDNSYMVAALRELQQQRLKSVCSKISN